jgi:glucosyl-3-phosphoglycerate synthase
MGDFHQNGMITTLHNLGQRPLESIEKELDSFKAERPMGLVLPSLFSELEGPALAGIVDELTQVPYLNEIVIGLDRADEAQYRYALDYFKRLPQHHRVLWNDGPRMLAIDEQLKDIGLAPSQLGKGRNVWYCYGYILASGRATSVALHDCDILTYDRSLLARLIYPVANPNFSYVFCKGYYSRVADNKIGGRVTRLFVTPLIRTLKKVSDQLEFLDYLDSFRYPLAGEFSIRADVINDLRIPSDWGLEVGVLSEMKRNYAKNRLCQADIADIYDHKHQELSAEDSEKGLSKMTVDIAKALFRKLATNGDVFSTEKFRTIKATYYRIALDFIDTYHNDAIINGLKYDRHQEEQAVELFAKNIMAAGDHFLENPMDKPFIPSWNRVISAIPDILDQLKLAVEEDNREFRHHG